MPKFFTVVAALLFLAIAAAHAYRAYTGIEVVVASHLIPMWVSWVGAGVAAFLGIMLFVECPRGVHGPSK